jgi:transcriptional regulator with XRE-family HTH domain
MDIGRAILDIRKGMGLKQEAVALDAGTDTGYLSRIENGARQPSLRMLEKIAGALGVSCSSILVMAEGGAVDTEALKSQAQPSNVSDATQLCRQFDTLTPDNQRVAMELLKALHRLQANG